MTKKILFVTTVNLSANPRLLKEIRLASEIGYDVSFLAFKLGNWGDEIDKEHIKSFNYNSIYYIDATRNSRFNWLISFSTEKISGLLYNILHENLNITAYSSSKRSFQLWRFLKKHKQRYDLIIAHNLAALYPVYRFAKKKKIKFAFDIEDYHPGEKIIKNIKNESNRRVKLMSEIIPECAFFTYASPLIGEYTDKLISQKNIPPNVLLNNCFPANEFATPVLNQSYNKVKFVWFSQHISHGRGLELIFPVIYKFRDQIDLELIGNPNKEFINGLGNKYKEIFSIIQPLSQKKLNMRLSQYDIGLAIELSCIDLNKNLALSNKIFAYAQAGLYILATNTKAQTVFINAHPELGTLCDQSVTDMENAVAKLIRDIKKIRESKYERFIYAKQLSWEIESEKLKSLWYNVLK